MYKVTPDIFPRLEYILLFLIDYKEQSIGVTEMLKVILESSYDVLSNNQIVALFITLFGSEKIVNNC